MRIGIAVVYLVSEKNGPLFDLHLRLIERNTEHPYTIYACVNGLLPQFHGRLREDPHVKICPCETYPGGSALWPPAAAGAAAEAAAIQSVASESKYEHSWYLEQLIRTAIDDGVSHVAIFHVDSFPIRRGWDSELMHKLSDRCVLAGVTRDPARDAKPLTAGILFTREFYRQYQPRLLLSKEQFDSEDYRRFSASCPHVGDSGVGYGFKMFMEGLTWHPLARSNLGGSHALFASVHGDLIFHLHATVYIERTKNPGFTIMPHQHRGLLGAGARAARALLPLRIRRWVRGRIRPLLESRCESMDLQAWEQERRRLFENPDAYILYLRTGIR
jgi:hypothetical protein